MKIINNAPLEKYSSFGVGGPAQKLIIIEDNQDIAKALEGLEEPIWVLGFGTNILISDKGLGGTTLLMRNNKLAAEGELVVADAGTWWDDLVEYSVTSGYFGIELLSGVPGSVGAGVYINIAAYGQNQSNTLAWIESVNLKTGKLTRRQSKKLTWDYKQSYYQDHPDELITRAAYRLSRQHTTELKYQWALDVARELNLKPDTLEHRREIILETRKRAGSLYFHDGTHERTAGSYFRNPLVTSEQADYVIRFDESGRSLSQIRQMNKVHGGSQVRASANHVMLAAGFKRGQTWDHVRLHPNHVLKIEALPGATAQEIYAVGELIRQTVREKLDINLEPEVAILGDFN